MGDHVFICYARQDQEFVLKLAANLKERGVPVWLDQWDIPASADWDLTIDDALYDCARFLIVLSPAARASREVRGELRTALDEDKPIVPVLYQTCRIPRQLRLIQYVDFTSRGPDNEIALGEALRALGMAGFAPPKPKKKRLDTQALEEKPIGRVIRYFDQLGVVGIELTDPLHVGDVIRIRGRTTDFTQQAESIEIDRQRVNQAPANAQIGLLVNQPARVGDKVYKVTDERRKRVLLTERDKNEKPIGRVIQYFDRLGVAGIELTDPLRVGDVIHIRGRTTDFIQPAESIELDRQRVNQAPAGAQIGLLVDQRTRVGDEVYKVTDKGR